MIRWFALAAAAAPFFWFAAQDVRYHLGPRKPGLVENVVHLLLGAAQIALFVSAARASLRGEVASIAAIAVLGAVDEFVFHRGLPLREADLHAKSHFALFVFVAAALTLDQWVGPAVIHVDERHFQWVYSATALTGLLLALLLPSSARVVPPPSRRIYTLLQVLTLLGAIVGAKLSFLAGDLGWPLAPVGWRPVVFSGRSITGGLLGGFLLAEAAKIPLRYRELPNDWFATKVPLAIAVGRMGCVLAGCCRGVPGDYPLSFVYSDGIPRFPAQMSELAFQVAAFGACLTLYRGGVLRGRVFALYMIGYGAFRLVLEAMRETPKLPSGFSVYQFLALALMVCGLASFEWYSRVGRLARSSAGAIP